MKLSAREFAKAIEAAKIEGRREGMHYAAHLVEMVRGEAVPLADPRAAAWLRLAADRIREKANAQPGNAEIGAPDIPPRR